MAAGAGSRNQLRFPWKTGAWCNDGARRTSDSLPSPGVRTLSVGAVGESAGLKLVGLGKDSPAPNWDQLFPCHPGEVFANHPMLRWSLYPSQSVPEFLSSEAVPPVLNLTVLCHIT